MGIDYVVDFDCEPKRALGLDRILGLLKDRSRALAALELLRRQGAEIPSIEGVELELIARTPEGDAAPRRLKVKEVLDRAVALEEFAPACDGCPANNTGRAYGCIGTIGYPLSAASESWLVGRVRAGPGASLLRAVLKELVAPGTEIAKMRAAGTVFFEARVAPAREDLGFPFAADHILDLIFCKGHLVPQHASIVLLVLSAIRRVSPVPDESTLQPGSALLVGKDDAGREQAQIFDMSVEATDEDSVRELKAFLRALFLARGFGVKLLVDY